MIKFHSAKCLAIALWVWEIALLSLVLDLALIGAEKFGALNALLTPALILLGVAMVGLKGKTLIAYGKQFGLLRRKFLAKYAHAAIFIAVFFSIIEAFLHFGGPLTIRSLLVAGVLSIPVGIATYRKLRNMVHAAVARDVNLVSRVESFNLQLLALSIVPILSARAASLLAAIGLPSNQSIMILALATALILSLKPEEGSFRSLCKGCHRPTSLALMDLHICPACRPHFFIQTEIGASNPQILPGLKSWPIWHRLSGLWGR